MTILDFLNKKIKSGELPLYDIIAVVSRAKNCSKSHARRLIDQKAVKINNRVVGIGAVILDGDILQVGKRWFYKLTGFPEFYEFKV